MDIEVIMQKANGLIRSVEYALKRPVVLDEEVVYEGEFHIIYQVDNIADVYEVIKERKLDEKFGFEVEITPDHMLILYPK